MKSKGTKETHLWEFTHKKSLFTSSFIIFHFYKNADVILYKWKIIVYLSLVFNWIFLLSPLSSHGSSLTETLSEFLSPLISLHKTPLSQLFFHDSDLAVDCRGWRWCGVVGGGLDLTMGFGGGWWRWWWWGGGGGWRIQIWWSVLGVGDGGVIWPAWVSLEVGNRFWSFLDLE